jgi:hypothetical protein
MNSNSHLYDILNSKTISPITEARRIAQLFFDDPFRTGGYGRCVLKDYIASDFRLMKCRGTYTDIDEYLRETLPSTNILPFTVDQLAIYCEVIANLFNRPLSGMHNGAVTRITQIDQNIHIIFDKTGYKFIDREGILYAVRKDSTVDEAVEHIPDDKVALDVLEYNRVSLKGNLARKKEILASFGLYAEQFLKDPAFADQFKQLRSDAGFCLNNLNIRHNPTANKASQLVLIGMQDPELEEWYDRTYTLLISVILMNKTRGIHTQLDPLKQKAGNPNG